MGSVIMERMSKQRDGYNTYTRSADATICQPQGPDEKLEKSKNMRSLRNALFNVSSEQKLEDQISPPMGGNTSGSPDIYISNISPPPSSLPLVFFNSDTPSPTGESTRPVVYS